MKKLNYYKVYFYSQPNFLVLNFEDVQDINLLTRGRNKTKFIEILYEDLFFYFNIKESKSKDWSMTVQIFDENKKFQSQIDIYGEDLKLITKEDKKLLRLKYDQITNNNGWPSVPKVFEQAEDNYTLIKKAFFRNQKLNEILK